MDMDHELCRNENTAQPIQARPLCPMGKAIGVLQGKWNGFILFALAQVKSSRFGELKRQIDGISNTALAAALKDLEHKDLICRVQFEEIPPRVEYSLTDTGRALLPILQDMASWGSTIPDEK